MKPKKKTRKKRGHRQEITRLMINSISMNGSAIASLRHSKTRHQSPTKPLLKRSTTEETAEAASE
jgi:large subunit ribosomal protein L21